MQYKGIEYTIQARPGQHQWTWTIRLDSGRTRRGEIRGTRALAEERAIRAITAWLQTESRQPGGTSPKSGPPSG
jgi:hypothetical protein